MHIEQFFCGRSIYYYIEDVSERASSLHFQYTCEEDSVAVPLTGPLHLWMTDYLP